MTSGGFIGEPGPQGAPGGGYEVIFASTDSIDSFPVLPENEWPYGTAEGAWDDDVREARDPVLWMSIRIDGREWSRPQRIWRISRGQRCRRCGNTYYHREGCV